MQIAHASLPADDPRRAAQFLAEIMGGTALPFPPGGPQSWMAWSGDEAIELEIVPRGRLMAPDAADGADWRERVREAPRRSEAHLAIAVERTPSQIREIAVRAGWPCAEFDRGGFFRVVEVWVEGAFLIEFLDPEQAQAYRSSMTLANWRKVFGVAA